MYKLSSLHDHLKRAIPALQVNPDKLTVLARGGKIVATGTGSLSFEYTYTIQVVLLDFEAHADSLMVPVLAWVQIHQPEILDNPVQRERAIRFECEMLNRVTVDLMLEVDVTERVLVGPKNGQTGALEARHVGEPPHPGAIPVEEHWTLWLKDQVLAEWSRDPR